MTGFDYFKDALFNKYAKFDGRARRSEYWYFTLFLILFLIAPIFILAFYTGFSMATSDDIGGGLPIGLISMLVLFSFVFLALLIPSLAVAVRRLHDAGYSGWFILFGFIPYVGGLITLYFYVQDSQKGTNQYGPNPKEIEADGTTMIQDNLV